MQTQIPEPVFLNIDYFFGLISRIFQGIADFIFSESFLILAKIIAIILIIFLISVIIYGVQKIKELEDEKNKNAPKAPENLPPSDVSPQAKYATGPTVNKANNKTWEDIREKMLSDNQNDWRLGIIEGDIYMDKLLEEKGLYEDTLGDKLKKVTPDLISSVQMAWEVHKARNKIAHQGKDYVLTMPEVRRLLSYFEIIFRDLGAIE